MLALTLNPMVAMPFYLHDCIRMEFHRVRQNYLHKYYMNFMISMRTAHTQSNLRNHRYFLVSLFALSDGKHEPCWSAVAKEIEQCFGSGDLHSYTTFYCFRISIAHSCNQQSTTTQNHFLLANGEWNREKLFFFNRIAFD